MIKSMRKYTFLGFLAIAGCTSTVTKEEFIAYQRETARTIDGLKDQDAAAHQKALLDSDTRYHALLKRLEDINSRLSVASLDNYAIALEDQTNEHARQYAELARTIADLHKKGGNQSDANKRELAMLRADAKSADDALTAKIADLNKLLEESKEAYETLKIDASKAAPEKPNAETYKCPLSYENPLVAQMLPGIVKAAYQKAVASGNQKDWAVYEIAARFFVDQNIDNSPHDGAISNAEFKKFSDEHPELELVVSSDRIADEFKVEFPEPYKTNWREIRAKVNRIADLESRNKWSDSEFVRYALMPGMEKTPDGRGYFISKAYTDHFEQRVDSAIKDLEDKK